MTDSYVQLAPDGAGKAVDAQALVNGSSVTVYRQTVTVGDPTAIGVVQAVKSALSAATTADPAAVVALSPNSNTVQVGNFPGTQTVAGTVTLSGTSAVSGAVSVSNFPGTQTVAGTVALSGTSAISGAVSISNFPGTQTVAGTVALSGTSAVSGAVSVSNFPGTQTVAGTVTLSGTAPISGVVQLQDGSANPITSQNFAGIGPGGASGFALRTMDLNSAADGATYAAGSLPPQVGVIAGHGQDGYVRALSVDASGAAVVNVAALTAAQTSDSPLFVALTGDPSGDFAGVNLLEQVMSDGSGLALNVRVLNQPAQDANGALIASDCKPLTINNVAVGTSVIIDTAGYQSVQFAAQSLAGNITASNDQINWTALAGASVAYGGLITTVQANSNSIFAALARFIRVSVTTAGGMTVYLRSAPFLLNGYIANVSTNMNQIGSAALASIGSAALSTPLPIGGADSAGLARRLLTDASGRPQGAAIATDNSGTQRQIGVMPNTWAGVPSLLVQDATQTEMGSIAELLLLLLTELRIANQQRYDLAVTSGLPDEPAAYRADPSLLN